jgi:hypothetical protein
MSIASNFPAIKPSLNLDFANVQQLDSRVTFSRASSATYYGTETAKAEENLLLQSQDFTTTWVNTSTSDTANTSVAPDGTTTADTITASAETSAHVVVQSLTIPVARCVLSVFVKAGTYQYFQLAVGGQTGTFANFDVTAGSGVVGTNAGVISSSIVDVGNDWYRCIMVFDNATGGSARLNLAASASATREQAWTAAGTETLILWGAQLEQRSAVTAYTPTTTQPITNYIPVLESAAAGVSRFDHNPTTFESLGLLIEEQRTNLLTYSAEFDNAAWTKTNSSITANTIVAPDGTLTGDKFVEDTSTGNHIVQEAASFTAGTIYTLSVYFKAAERTSIRILLAATAFGSAIAWRFNLTNGAATPVSGTAGTTAAATLVGNGWYRCAITTFAATATASSSPQIYLENAANVVSYTGDGYSGIYIWGAQLEAGAFATSYIPTVAASATRSADVATMTGANFSSWYNQSEGTLFAEATPQASTAGGYALIEAGDGTDNNRIGLFKLVTSGNASLSVRDSNVQQVSTNSGAWTVTGKLAGAYKLNDFASSFNGGAVATDTSGTVPVVNQLTIGRRQSGENVLNGTIRRIAYYPLRVTNAQLQALTS